VALRYFNAAGADPEGELGEEHEHETHLIPLAIGAALGQRERLQIFGTDYPTPDGTAIRDYIHVTDLASAHICALEYLNRGEESQAINLGTGRGASVREVIATVQLVSGHTVPTVAAPRRAGDPPVLVASPELARRSLRWEPSHSSLERIIETAWRWHSGARRQAGPQTSPSRVSS
jgi:UDP-arabinose 4-epimerase